MNRSRQVATLSALLVLAGLTAATPGLGQSAADLELSLQGLPAELVLEAGATTQLPVTVDITGLPTGAGLPTVDARLVGPNGSLVSQAALSHQAGTTWTGALTLEHTQAPGTYEVQATAELLGDAVGSEVALEILPITALEVLETRADFGAGLPNTWLGPAALTVRNLGNVDLDIVVRASELTHEDGTGDPIAPDRITVGSATHAQAVGQDGYSGLAPIPVASQATVDLWLHLPSGATQYVAPGDYAGSLTVSVQGVSS